MHLKLDRPLVCFDLETTGTDVEADRIVEICALRLDAEGRRDLRSRRINPERPIPPGATAVHGIRDEDVRDAPTFRQIARSLFEFLDGADLAGYNVARFDVPLLEREFRDCGLDLGLGTRRVVDAMAIYHRMEPRDLPAAVRFYLGREHHGAHSAREDVLASIDVLEAQLERYPGLPREVAGLAAAVRRVPPEAVDRAGKFLWREGQIVFSFGKHQGRSLREIAGGEPDYLRWILETDFPDDARELVARALRGELPPGPGPAP
ncbi:MAG TPA: 3'-5' exonuclease [Candidatus Polarisedimenticolaceae bacterium]|nr:3'-5' exonuclease [Candidatus Polarisedimenticolaceae bacterium]